MNYVRIYEDEEKIKEQEIQEELRQYGLDDESIKEFRSKINKVSYEESQKLGKELGEFMLNNKPYEISINKVNDYILKGADVNVSFENNSYYLIHIASSLDISVLISLIKAGVNIDAQTIYGETCAMICASYIRDDFLKILVLMGANLAIKDRKGYTALDYAEDKINLECIDIIKNAMGLYDINIIYNERNKRNEYLKQYGLDVETIREYRSKINSTHLTSGYDLDLLLENISKNNLNIVNELIINGVPLNSFSINFPILPLEHSIRKKNFEISILLLKGGSTISAIDMICAIERDMYELCKIMILMGINLNEISDDYKLTPLEYVKQKKLTKYIELFESVMNGNYSIIYSDENIKRLKKEETMADMLENLKAQKYMILGEYSKIIEENNQKVIKK